jgi:hypothetical protein
MKEDIAVPEVTNVMVAVVPRTQGGEDDLWDIYVINEMDEPMENVLITSQGYGILNGRDKTTTVLRHFHQIIPPMGSLKIEPIQPELFGIQNEYWVSFNARGSMLDKKFIFPAGSINEEQLRTVPVLNQPGVVVV